MPTEIKKKETALEEEHLKLIQPLGEWQRTHYSNDIPKKDGTEIIAAGWVRSIRKLGKIAFIQLSDREGSIQIVAKDGETDPETLKTISELGREYVIAVKGTIKTNKSAPNGIELSPIEVKVLSVSEPQLPLEIVTKKTPAEFPTRIDSRYIDLRKPEVAAIFRIKSIVGTAFREFWDQTGYIEIQSPKLMSAPSESGASVFAVPYFKTEAFLAQSPQFYKQMMMSAGLEKVYETGPVFRAEKHHTYRHVTEFTSFDFEMSFIRDYNDLMSEIEKLMVYVFKRTKDLAKKELSALGIELTIPKTPFPKVPVAEAHEMVQATGHDTDPTEDLDSEGEKIFGDLAKKKFKHDFVFLTEFPWSVRPFYHMRDPKNPDKTFSTDLLYKGLEIATCAQREHRYHILMEQLKEKGLTPEPIQSYLNSFRHGTPPHGGAGLGIERIVMKALNLPTVHEAILFPRTPERLTP